MAIKNVGFSSPPINEIVFGVEHSPDGFRSVHYGMLWQMYKTRFPKIVDRIPIGVVSLGNIAVPQELLQTQDQEAPILPRVWFENNDGKKLIQIQPDRFHFNWRKTEDTDVYPQFENLRPQFLSEWEVFDKWWKSNIAPQGPINRRFELSYINHVDTSSGWQGPQDNTKIFHCFNLNKLPKSLNLKGTVGNFHFDTAAGVLSISIRQGLRRKDNRPLMVFELTVKEKKGGNADVTEWFDLAHDAIIEGFLGVTSEFAHNAWGYTNA